MDIVMHENSKFLIYNEKNISIGFSTAEGGLNFNKFYLEGQKNLNFLKEWFKVDKVIYLNQIHSTKVISYDGSDEVINTDGDGIVTQNKNVLIGVFTADCVPVIIVDVENGVMAAIHSGWKGTLNNIVAQGVNKMIKDYGSNPKKMKAFIGPHNKVCCYEVSEELIDKFKQCKLFENVHINEGRNLNLQRCVEVELINLGIIQENIITVNLCTYCSDKTKLYSYRKKEESKGRLFSFVFANEED